MDKQISGTVIDVNEEGFMNDFKQWNREIGEALAKENNIELTSRHWEVLTYIQKQFTEGIPLSIRKIGNSGVLDIKEFYQLFPTAPLKTATKIAGIPKPVSCI